ncbi:unnamed protein product [Gadus morhua 'NCC']
MAALVQMACWFHGRLAVRAGGVRPLIPGLVPAHFRSFSLRRDPEEPEELEENPFYSRYREKIQRARRAKPEESQTRAELRVEQRHESRVEQLGASQAEFVRRMEEELEKRDHLAASGRETGGFTKDKTLASILDMDLVQDKTGKEISELWMRFYSTKDTISAVISTETFGLMFSRAEACPRFLFALPQAEGYEFFLGEWSGPQLHFTSLINAQVLGGRAPSQLVLYHFPELQERGVVLMTAERDPKVMTVHQAQCLANQVQLFYGSPRPETFRLVESFNHAPAGFQHMAAVMSRPAELCRPPVAAVLNCSDLRRKRRFFWCSASFGSV